jgi:predicted nucleotidyltransferase
MPSFPSANGTGYEDVIVVRRETLVMTELQLSSLPNLPQREAIAEVASNLWQDVGVVALWVGGSLASGAGDHFSDVDFRVAVVPDQLARWQAPRFEQLFTRASIVGRLVLQFGNEALLHHLVLSNGVIFDFFISRCSGSDSSAGLASISGWRAEGATQRLNV